jgi:hypothetical protein
MFCERVQLEGIQTIAKAEAIDLVQNSPQRIRKFKAEPTAVK